MLPRFRECLDKGDTALNTISLHWWDSISLNPTIRENVSRALLEHGDRWSLAGSVCTLKQAAIEAALRPTAA
jgi:hypothetical protein